MRMGRYGVQIAAILAVIAGATSCSNGAAPSAPAASAPGSSIAGTGSSASRPNSMPPSMPPSKSSARPPTRSAASTKPPVPPAGPSRSPKKGVSAWYFNGFTEALGDVGASWYYNWAAGRGNLIPPAGVEYAPMIWGGGSVKQSTLDLAKSQGTVLLGFNEPDLKEQSNMTVQQALDLWPQLEATGMRLGSPAPAWGAATPGSWFDQFMAGAAQRGYRVDFIALHWYGSDFGAAATSQLKSYLQAVYNRYHKPIWLTEYALINFSGPAKYPTQAQQAAFARSSVAMLEGLSYVERYAWFALPATAGSGTGLYKDGHTPTGVGAAYRAAPST